MTYLARDMNLACGELRYLTLPGNDLLDIRHIHDSVCRPNQIKLKYLGFNTAAQPTDPGQPELNSAEFSIKRLDFVDSESEVFPGDFRHVGNQTSISWKRVRRAGHFHAINLDLCGGFAGNERADGIPSYFSALQWILQNQSGSREDFLLFITTRMDDDSIDQEKKVGLDAVAQTIYETCTEYASEFRKAWGLSSQEPPALVISESVETSEAFMLGLTQWIITRSIDVGLKASVKSFMTYRTGSGTGADDLVSLAIRFKPDPAVREDPYGLAEVGQEPGSARLKECQQASPVPSKVNKRILVDELLKTQAELFERCLEGSSALLQKSGYDAALYREWVMKEKDRYATA